jgi:trans-aconitate methyltransferase
MNYIKTKEELNNFFTKEYYTSINYTDYTSRIDKYNNTSQELYDHLNMTTSNSILDYGCAIGLLLNGFANKGSMNLTGFDISDWAVNNAINSSLKLTTDFDVITKGYDYTFALDVFEHMFDDDVDRVLENLNTKTLVVRIPCKLSGESDFHLEVSRKDKSHINCKTKGEWIDVIELHGYEFTHTLKLNSIYESAGCFCGVFIKK